MAEEVFIVDLRKYRQKDLGRVQTELGWAIIEKKKERGERPSRLREKLRTKKREPMRNWRKGSKVPPLG